LDSIKKQLYNLCLEFVNQRMDAAKQAISIAQASANEETKSSAGDKYETGRAMMQLEIEKNTIQLAQASQLKQTLDKLQVQKQLSHVQLGSLVLTSQGNFYIAISAGQLQVEGKPYMAIAASSPIGIKLMGLRAGDRFIFNTKEFVVQEVF
jgi:transcription elongation GreA/GreB family factor